MLILLLMIAAVALFFASLIGLFVWVLQFIILNVTARRLRPLRWLLLAPSVLALYLSVRAESYLWAGLAIVIFVGWALGWAVYRFVCGGDREEPAEPRL